MRKLHFFSILVALSLATSSLWALPTGVVNGKLLGAFTVNAQGKKVYFSQGNLQYCATADGTGTDLSHNVAGGGTAQGIWRFAENQYDFVGGYCTYSTTTGNVYVGETRCDNSKLSSTYTGWIDLFNWGHTGYNGSEPYAYPATNGSISATGSYTYLDWGVYNAISNGGNQPGLWRLPTSAEIGYMCSSRPNASSLRREATVNGVSGTIFLPDGRTDITLTTSYTAEQWNVLEEQGAVFFPIANYRFNQYYQNDNVSSYWHSGHDHYSVKNASFTSWTNNATTQGFAVRLVSDTPPPTPATVTSNPTYNSSLVYTDNFQNLLTNGGAANGGTLYYKVGTDGAWSTDIPQAKAIGDYAVYYYVKAANASYVDSQEFGPINVSITCPEVSDDADPSTTLSNLYTAGNATPLIINRTIWADGEYNTICLPFAITKGELETSTHPLYGYERLKAFKGASVSGSGQDLSIDIFVEDVDHIDAAVPYLISYPADRGGNIVDPVFTGITVTKTETDLATNAVSANGVTFQGMFAQVHIDPYTNERDEDYLFLGANSQLNWPLASETSSDVKMRGFRAYFIIDRNAIPALVAPRGTHARFVNAPKQPTGIENTELNTQAQKLFENGQLIILKNGIKYNAQGQVLK